MQLLAEARASSPKPKRRVDPRVGRKRYHGDGVDDFELELLRHGINLEDLQRVALQYDKGTRTPHAKLAHAVMRWWLGLPMGQRKVVWCDPASGYTERTLPKLSSSEGADLVARGLAGARWVYSRAHLLAARTWARHMLTLTPLERLQQPVESGDERLGYPDDGE